MFSLITIIALWSLDLCSSNFWYWKFNLQFNNLTIFSMSWSQYAFIVYKSAALTFCKTSSFVLFFHTGLTTRGLTNNSKHFLFGSAFFEKLLQLSCNNCIKYFRLTEALALIASSSQAIVKEGIQEQSFSAREDNAQFALCTHAALRKTSIPDSLLNSLWCPIATAWIWKIRTAINSTNFSLQVTQVLNQHHTLSLDIKILCKCCDIVLLSRFYCHAGTPVTTHSAWVTSFRLAVLIHVWSLLFHQTDTERVQKNSLLSAVSFL